jgi:hypothetical protein
MAIGTAQRLESIDHATFERLADAVIASANSAYTAVLHTGVNAKGKTVVAPVDGFCLVPSSSPPHFILVQHTTTAKKSLRGKWLLGCEGSKIQSEKREVRKPGDLKKASFLAAALKPDFPTARFTVVLTTNQAVDEKLYSDAQRIALALALQLDVWDQTRICRYLDTTATGQWLRWYYLGVVAQQVSRALLQELSRRSWARYRGTLASSEGTWVRRDVEEEIERLCRRSTQLLIFLVGHSGSGKSVIAGRLFEARCDANELCFWIPSEYLETSATIEEALVRAVTATESELWPGAADQLLRLLSKESRFTLVVDDINRSRDPGATVRKLIAWLYPRGGAGETANSLAVQVLCPLWQTTADQFSARADASTAWRQINVGLLSAKEGRSAIHKAASLAERSLSALDVDAIAAQLGDDIYTIGLWAELLRTDGSAPRADLSKNVQERFLSEALARASAAASCPAHVLDTALRQFGSQMLERRNLQPMNADIAEWFAHKPDVSTALNALLQHGYLMRLDNDGRILFRHDRLRDELLCRGMRLALNNSPELLREPFYARYLGRAAAETS